MKISKNLKKNYLMRIFFFTGNWPMLPLPGKNKK